MTVAMEHQLRCGSTRTLSTEDLRRECQRRDAEISQLRGRLKAAKALRDEAEHRLSLARGERDALRERANRLIEQSDLKGRPLETMQHDYWSELHKERERGDELKHELKRPEQMRSPEGAASPSGSENEAHRNFSDAEFSQTPRQDGCEDFPGGVPGSARLVASVATTERSGGRSPTNSSPRIRRTVRFDDRLEESPRFPREPSAAKPVGVGAPLLKGRPSAASAACAARSWEVENVAPVGSGNGFAGHSRAAQRTVEEPSLLPAIAALSVEVANAAGADHARFGNGQITAELRARLANVQMTVRDPSLYGILGSGHGSELRCVISGT
mmetsp:Transcript_63006/g.136804  ORF Transcript_63006/g.136804 Transcript_63006/m.136804 type:complete len:328 (-) Transcript_63006:56-1039(-)